MAESGLSRGPVLCRIGIHRYRELGMFGLGNLIERCRRCGQGRMFSTLIGASSIIPAEQMRERFGDD